MIGAVRMVSRASRLRSGPDLVAHDDAVMAGLRWSKGGQIEIGSGGTGECIGWLKNH